jgi:hypothetical protein
MFTAISSFLLKPIQEITLVEGLGTVPGAAAYRRTTERRTNQGFDLSMDTA